MRNSSGYSSNNSSLIPKEQVSLDREPLEMRIWLTPMEDHGARETTMLTMMGIRLVTMMRMMTIWRACPSERGSLTQQRDLARLP
jgi:hypothetical protein